MATQDPIRRDREAVVFSNGYGRLFNDAVTSPSGRPGAYLRWQWAVPGVVVVPVRDGRVALAQMYRYPIGGVSLELPRGGRTHVDEPPDRAAERELREELGLVAVESMAIGVVFPDTGLIETPVDIVMCHVADGDHDARLEDFESAGDSSWYRPADITEAMRDGRLRCGLSIAALAVARACGAFGDG